MIKTKYVLRKLSKFPLPTSVLEWINSTEKQKIVFLKKVHIGMFIQVGTFIRDCRVNMIDFKTILDNLHPCSLSSYVQ